MPVISDQSAIADSHISSFFTTTNYASDDLPIGEDSGSARTERALVKWALPTLPVNIEVNNAYISIWPQSATAQDNARTLRAYQILAAWVEAEVTWIKRDASNNWVSAGCSDTTSDRVSSAIGSVAVADPPTLDAEIQIPLDVDMIREMLIGDFTNNGFLLQMDVEANDLVSFYGSETGDTTKRPKITIDYTLLSSGAMLGLI